MSEEERLMPGMSIRDLDRRVEGGPPDDDESCPCCNGDGWVTCVNGCHTWKCRSCDGTGRKGG